MQCPACRAVYSNGLDTCPRCKTPASTSSDSETRTVAGTEESGPSSSSAAAGMAENSPSPAVVTQTSTLIEFPGTARASRPQWRKELSARVRQIQERRAREAEEVLQRRLVQPLVLTLESEGPALGLVPTPDAPAVNPIVAAALKRIERANQSPPRTRTRSSIRTGAVAATARVAEEHYQTEPVRVPTQALEPKPSAPTREHQLAVVAGQPAVKPAAIRAIKSQPRRDVADVVSETPSNVSDLATSQSVPVEELYDDRASVFSRIAGSLIDLLVVAFASSPFAAIIELSIGNWTDWRVIASMSGIVLLVMFLYLTASTALAGRTWGMSVVSLRAVDADTGLPPTTKQSVGRAILYILSLATFGLGLLYALFDAEARTLHDHLSGTAVVRE